MFSKINGYYKLNLFMLYKKYTDNFLNCLLSRTVCYKTIQMAYFLKNVHKKTNKNNTSMLYKNNAHYFKCTKCPEAGLLNEIV